jgi:hypothetical protein
MRAHFAILAAITAVSNLVAGAASAADADDSAKTRGAAVAELDQRAAETLEQALRAENSGEQNRRAELLTQARQESPGYAPARWQSGQLRWQGKWQTVEEITTAAAQDPQRLEYLKLRYAPEQSAEHERMLAEWCLKHKFVAEAQIHWRKLLNYEPADPVALRELGLHPYKGELLSSQEIATRRKESELRQRAQIYWKPRLAALRRECNNLDNAKRAQARAEIGAITDPEVIPTFETLLQTDGQPGDVEFGLAMIRALAAMSDRRATEALVREAALSKWPEVRAAAIAALKPRDLMEYVPYSLANLSTLYEQKYSVVVDPNGTVHYEQRLLREGAEADDYIEHRNHVTPMIGTRFEKAHPVERPDSPQYSNAFGPTVMPGERRRAANESRWMSWLKTQKLIAEDEAVVSEFNRVIDERNQALRQMLSNNVGTDEGEDPHAWWDWWKSYNELNYPPYRPVNYYGDDSNYYTYVHYRRRGFGYSCFVAGTPVWTLTGPRQIESIQPGDRVLAQDPQTGELAFKTVLQTTVRAPSPTRTIVVDRESIVATQGHRFWKVGRGWQMAKELDSGGALHGVQGSLPIESVADTDEAEAFNLVVEDFHTYFVGQSCVLVHDNSAPKPLLGPVPGLVQKDATPAAK